MANEDVVIEIPADETIVKVEKPEKVEKVVETKVESEDEGIDDLKGQYATLQQCAENERLARERSDKIAADARAEAAAAREDATEARGEALEGRTSAVENAIAAARAEAESAARDFEAADGLGDSKGKADAQRKIARAEAKLLRFEEAKDDLANRKPEPPAKRAEPERPADPYAGFTPRAAAWMKEHPEFLADAAQGKKATAAHNLAMLEGYIPDSDAYFDFCERKLGLKDEPEVERPVRAQPKPKTRTSVPSAPVSRDGSSPTNGNLGANQVVLTVGEQRAATDGSVVWNVDDPKIGAVKGEPVGLREFARRKSLMTKDGRYDRSYVDS